MASEAQPSIFEARGDGLPRCARSDGILCIVQGLYPVSERIRKTRRVASAMRQKLRLNVMPSMVRLSLTSAGDCCRPALANEATRQSLIAINSQTN
jgi:hypothetical protein